MSDKWNLANPVSDYYNEHRDFQVYKDPKYGPALGLSQPLPFDCPNCGEQLVSLQFQMFNLCLKTSPIHMVCRYGCHCAFDIPYEDFLNKVPQIKELLGKK